jgi:hypothetical protein
MLHEPKAVMNSISVNMDDPFILSKSNQTVISELSSGVLLYGP